MGGRGGGVRGARAVSRGGAPGSRSRRSRWRSRSSPACSARRAAPCSTRSARSSASRRARPRSSRSPLRGGCSSPRTRAPGSSSRTGRSGCSGATARRPGRRSAASSSRRAGTSSSRSTPEGDVRWSLARPDVRFPRWGGTRTDTRIAYLSDGELRVVGGDGKGDRLLDRQRGRPGAAVAARRRPRARLHAARRHHPRRRRRHGQAARRGSGLGTSTRGGRRRSAHGSSATGDFAEPVRSPDGRWLAVGWPEADQLVFVRAAGGRQIRAVSNVSSQFRSRSFPTISGWCCAP